MGKGIDVLFIYWSNLKVIKPGPKHFRMQNKTCKTQF